MTTRQPDFVIRCNHGQREGYADFIQRFRWTASQEQWMRTRRRTTDLTSLRGNETDDWLGNDNAGTDSPREHTRTRCTSRRCRNRVALDDNYLQDVFAVLSVSAELRALVAMDVKLDPSGAVTEVVMTLDNVRNIRALRNQSSTRAHKHQE